MFLLRLLAKPASSNKFISISLFHLVIDPFPNFPDAYLSQISIREGVMSTAGSADFLDREAFISPFLLLRFRNESSSPPRGVKWVSVATVTLRGVLNGRACCRGVAAAKGELER